MHRVFTTTELVMEVLSYLPQKDLLSCALVQKKWTEPSLNAAWHTVEDLSSLLRLLAPLVRQFVRTPEIFDWIRFKSIAKRVRKLCCRRNLSYVFHPDVFKDIALVRTTEDVFPNLHTLEWAMEIGSIPLFLHEHVHTLRLWLSPNHILHTATALLSLCANIKRLSPRLRIIDVASNISSQYIENEIMDLIGSLRLLETVVLPPQCSTPRLFSLLAALPSLSHLSLAGRGDVQETTTHHYIFPNLSPGSFNHLISLELNLPLVKTSAILASLTTLRSLTNLSLFSPDRENPGSIQDVLKAASRSFPRLESISVCPLVGGPPELGPFLRHLDFPSLRPLVVLSNLINLTLYHQTSFLLTLDNLTELTLSLPRLETCHLNHGPYQFRSAHALPCNAMFPFAQNCPKLRELGLYINALSPPSLSIDDPSFPQLKTLHLGNSPISEATKPALFLSQILPPYCEITIGVLWKNVDWARDDPQGICGRIHALWREVKALLPSFIQLRVDIERRVYARVYREFSEREALKRNPESSPTPSLQYPFDNVPPPSDVPIPDRSSQSTAIQPPPLQPASPNTSRQPSARPSVFNSPSPRLSRANLKIGDVVHASIPDRPLWPGMVISTSDPAQSGEMSSSSSSPPAQQYRVWLFGGSRSLWLPFDRLAPLKKGEILTWTMKQDLAPDLMAAYMAALDPTMHIKGLAANPENTPQLRPTPPRSTPTTQNDPSGSITVRKQSNDQSERDSLSQRTRKGKSSSTQSTTAASADSPSKSSTPVSKRTIAKVDAWRNQLAETLLGVNPLTVESFSHANSILSKLESMQGEGDLAQPELHLSGIVPTLRKLAAMPSTAFPSDIDDHNIRARAFDLVERWYVQFHADDSATKVKEEEVQPDLPAA
ncbi:hypothetical protein ONZ45_g3925 [Pleurotus djamor]|nr:hypothetical protein ONZ45_g3925 [Pleurotus djamor]